MKVFRILLKVILILLCVSANSDHIFAKNTKKPVKPPIIVTSDGEIDDQCSMIRFMLYMNECYIEGI